MLKRLLIKLVGRKKLLIIKGFIKRLRYYDSKVKTKCNVEYIEEKHSDCFIGYYDLCPEKENKLIYHVKKQKDNFVRIMLYDLEKKESQEVAKSNAWNWQQGSRARWYKKDVITFNDFLSERGKYVSRFVDLTTNEEKVFDYPFYDICGNLGATLDFVELGYLRPGYGYTNTSFKKHDIEDMAISIYDIDSGRKVDEISYVDIQKKVNDEQQAKECYINHISFAPKGSGLLFFVINIKNSIHHARLFYYDLSERILRNLENELSVSHYTWIDKSHILVTAYDEKRECRYYVYDTEGNRKPYLENTLKRDGHPTFLSNRILLTDTYPDFRGYEKVFFVMDKDDCEEIAEFYHSYRCFGEHRCDLHPRLSEDKTKVIVDTAFSGKRKIAIIEVGER